MRRSDFVIRMFAPRRVTAAAGLAVIAVSVGGATSLQPHLAVAAAVGAVLIGYASLAPARWLPGSALALFLAVPTAYLPLPLLVGRFLTPSVIVLAIWSGRVLLAERGAPCSFNRWWRRGAWALASWVAVNSVMGLAPQRSLAWSIVFGVTFLASGAAADRSGTETRQAFERAWLWSALVFGLFGCVEGLTHFNPLAAHFEIDGQVITQHWSVYRIETTLGHPLMNALAFATLAAGATMIVLTRPRALAVAAAVCSSGAVVFTGSRAGALALVLGTGIAALGVFFSRTTRPGWRVAAVLALGLVSAGVWFSPVLRNREASREGQVSSAYRSRLAEVAWRAIKEDSYLGSGPGTSQRRIEQYEPKTLVLENSPLQVLVSLGVPGFFAFLTLLAAAAWKAIRRRRWEGAAALIAAFVASTGFNGWDQVPVTLVMLGAALVLALAGQPDGANKRREGEPDVQSADHGRRSVLVRRQQPATVATLRSQIPNLGEI